MIVSGHVAAAWGHGPGPLLGGVAASFVHARFPAQATEPDEVATADA